MTGVKDTTAQSFVVRIRRRPRPDSGENGLKTVYARVGNLAGIAVTSDTIGLDAIPPSVVAAPTDDGQLLFSDEATFYWMAADDPAPASGVITYHLQVGTTPALTYVFDGEVGDTLSATVDGQHGQTHHGRVRAIDRAGNLPHPCPEPLSLELLPAARGVARSRDTTRDLAGRSAR